MKRYLLTSFLLTLGLCLLVGLFNYRVDPYALYHYDEANADSLSRIDQFYHMRIAKPWHLLQTKPTAVVVGTSRSGAIRPQHTSWPQTGSYNLSIPGATVHEMLRLIEHTQAVRPLDKMIIGLDFEAFIHALPQYRAGFDERRMARSADDLTSISHRLQQARDLSDTLVSLPGLTRSLSAVNGTWRGGRRYFKDGSWESTSKILTGSGGYIYVAKGYLVELKDEQPSLSSNLAILTEILRFAHRQNIDTRLFFTPEHVFLIDFWQRLGYGELWQAFQRDVVAANDAVALEEGATPFPLWGFNQEDGVANEPILKPRDNAQSLFSDGVHFRPQLGARIMAAVWGKQSDFGARLDAQSIEDYLVEVEELRHDFETANTDLTASLRHKISPKLK